MWIFSSNSYLNTETLSVNFFDVNAKLRYKSRKGRVLDVSLFASRDNLAVSKITGVHWGNLAGSINWSAGIGDNWRIYATGAVTDYASRYGTDIMDSKQKLRDTSVLSLPTEGPCIRFPTTTHLNSECVQDGDEITGHSSPNIT